MYNVYVYSSGFMMMNKNVSILHILCRFADRSWALPVGYSATNNTYTQDTHAIHLHESIKCSLADIYIAFLFLTFYIVE